jgi:hypothetical protein
VSDVVHSFPSLQGAVLFEYTQPDPGLQLSVVQGFPSSQFGAGPPTQCPPAHASPIVHALPSLHGAVLFAYTHAPDPGLQLSVVHAFPSVQVFGVPTQIPPEHASPVVHAFLSLQAFPFETGLHAELLVLGLHTWQGFCGLTSADRYRFPWIRQPGWHTFPQPQTMPGQQRRSLADD